MFNLELIHGKKNAKFYVTLTCIQVEKKWYLYKEIFTKDNRWSIGRPRVNPIPIKKSQLIPTNNLQ